jgi:(p)ppGpp synthase/HD superfamily hydrolase
MMAFEAMVFARHVHRDQVRKYTGNPYADHLAEVAGIVATVAGECLSWGAPDSIECQIDRLIAIAWLHDCVEDQGVTESDLADRFGFSVARDVMLLSDLEQGNRAERKAASRLRLAAAPGWVQSIKVADLISNTSSIVQNDPKFAVTYLEEKRLLLDMLTHADDRLVAVARNQIARAS